MALERLFLWYDERNMLRSDEPVFSVGRCDGEPYYISLVEHYEKIKDRDMSAAIILRMMVLIDPIGNSERALDYLRMHLRRRSLAWVAVRWRLKRVYRCYEKKADNDSDRQACETTAKRLEELTWSGRE